MAYSGTIFRLFLGTVLLFAVFIAGQLSVMPDKLLQPLLKCKKTSFACSEKKAGEGKGRLPQSDEHTNESQSDVQTNESHSDVQTNESQSDVQTNESQGPKQIAGDEHGESPLCPHPLVGLEQSFCAPRVFIGGAMKCGTNEAMHILQVHPRARFKTCPDRSNATDCTNINYQGVRDGKGNYHIWESKSLPTPGYLLAIANRLPDTDGVNTVSFDKSPGYLNTHLWHDIPSQMRHMMPGTKMVFTVCDPAERLFSEFNHLQRIKGFRLSRNIPLPQNFFEFVKVLNETADICGTSKEECTKVSEKYLRSGKYSEHVKKWLEVYPKSDMLVIEMAAGKTENAKRLLDFAGLPEAEYPWDELKGGPAYQNTFVKGYSGRDAAWTQYPEEMKLLSSIFSDSNSELAALLDAKFPLEWRSSKG